MSVKRTIIMGLGSLMVAGSAAGVGYLVYKKMHKVKPSPDVKPDEDESMEYDEFKEMSVDPDAANTVSSMIVGETTPNSQCEAKCNSDPNCKAYSFNFGTGQCVTTSSDPYAAAQESPEYWALYIKREPGAPESKWGGWSPTYCPDGCVGSSVSRKRTCIGKKCPGPTEKPCDNPICDKFENYEAGYIPTPAPTDGITLSHTESMTDCQKACLANPKCSALYWAKPVEAAHKNCTLISQQGYAVDGLVWRGPEYSSAQFSVRVPGVNNGEWGPMPLTSSCKCGAATKIDRPCKSGNCHVGPRFLDCGSASACAYDVFPDMVVH